MKNKILYTISYVALILFIIGACSIDSDGLLPVCMILLGAGWLGLFYYVNAEVLEGRK